MDQDFFGGDRSDEVSSTYHPVSSPRKKLSFDEIMKNAGSKLIHDCFPIINNITVEADIFTLVKDEKINIIEKDVAIIGSIDNLAIGYKGPKIHPFKEFHMLSTIIKPKLSFIDKKNRIIFSSYNGFVEEVLKMKNMLEDKTTSNGIYAFIGSFHSLSLATEFTDDDQPDSLSFNLKKVYYHNQNKKLNPK